ncbi:putative proteasome subunit beta type-4 [Rhodotorula toruloides]|nr:putative proteasome subunit beta type-4 [Rhodotorula toruloides]
MEVSFGITGKDYVLFASDTSAARSIVRMKADEDKQRVLGKHLVMAYSGEPGDTIQFAEYIERNLRLYQIRNHIPLRPPSAASWVRTQLASSLRSRKPYSVNLLLGGYDPTSSTPSLYWIDYLGTLATVPYAAHGYGAYFSLSTMDRWHDPEGDLEAGLELLRKCIKELEVRFIVNLGGWTIRVADKDGVRQINLDGTPYEPPQRPPPPATTGAAEAVETQGAQPVAAAAASVQGALREGCRGVALQKREFALPNVLLDIASDFVLLPPSSNCVSDFHFLSRNEGSLGTIDRRTTRFHVLLPLPRHIPRTQVVGRPPPPKMGAVRGRASPTLSLALLVLLAFAQLASASFASIKAQQDKDKPQAPPTYGGQEIVPGSFLIEVGGSSLSKRASGAADLTQVLSHLALPPSSTGKPFSLPAFSTSRTLAARPSLFNGAVVKVADPALLQKLKEGSESTVKQVLQELEGVDGISRAWPLRILPRPSAVINKDEGGGVSSGSAAFAASLTSSLAKRSGTTFPPASAYLNDTFNPHVMTGVDKLHNQGILGSNTIKVGILDTGVDYLNPILGGCFGPGCHISFGGDYTVDPPGPDPYVNCTDHGTHVTGTVGALANPLGFSGVAPNVQIGHYKVFRCSGGVPEDVLVAALTAATNDNVDVVTLSIGGRSGWLNANPSQVVLERMTSQEGIVATVSAGNSRSEGLFFAESPAALIGGMSVGSIDVEQLPAYPAQVVPFGSLPYLSSLPLDVSSLPASRNGYRLYFTSTTTTAADDACNPLPNSTPDLSNLITVVRRGTCSFYSQMANIAAKGGKVALVYNSPNANTMVPYYQAAGTSLAAVAALRCSAGTTLVLAVFTSPFHATLLSYFSEFGPTFELFGQPTLSGPGGNILSTFPLALGGLGVISGTSMSTPFVAGASALLLSQRKADNLNPADVRALLSSTASKRGTTINGTAFETVLLQGGGLVQVDKAISTRTIVSPFELMLNDTAFPAHTQKITLRNTNPFPMQYSVTTSSAQAYGTYDNGASTDILMSTNPKPVYPQSGVAAFSTQRLRLQAGQTYTFTVTIPQPRFNAMTVARFPLYSGYVDISGVSVDRKHSEELHIPYFGLAAAMSDMPVLDSTATIYGDVAYPFIANSGYSVFDAPGSLSGSETYSILFRLAAGTRFGSVDLILSSNAPPTTIPTERRPSTPPNRMARRSRKADLEERDAASHASHPISPRDLESTALYSDTPIVGTIESASPLPRDYLVDSPAEFQQYSEFTVPFAPDYSGFDLQGGTEYRVLVRALRTTADPKLASSYDSWVSYPFTISH